MVDYHLFCIIYTEDYMQAITEELNFYKADRRYVDFLRAEESKIRGVSYIPHLNYVPPQKEKFMCGIILRIGEIDYLAPISSYKIKQPNNVLLYDSKGNATSSVRLNYMFPIFPQFYQLYDFSKETDIKYRSVVHQERNSANAQREMIRRLALKTYQTVKSLKAQGKNFNWACDFELLEDAAKAYIMLNQD